MYTIRNAKIFVSLLGVLLLGLLSSCGGGGSSVSSDSGGPSPSSDTSTTTVVSTVIGASGGSLTSADGNTTLTVPAGALANDTKITMTEISGDDIPEELRDPSVLKVYDMQPDGLQFTVPATMEIHALGSPAPPDGAPLIGLISDHQGALAMLTPLTNTVDGDTGITVSAPISHFSSVATVKSKSFTVSLGVSPASLPVGDNFTLSMGITKSSDSLSDVSVTTKIVAGDPVKLPKNFDPPYFTLESGQPQFIKRDVTGTCLKADTAILTVLGSTPGTDGAKLVTEGWVYFLKDGVFEGNGSLIIKHSVKVECTKATPSPSPSVGLGLKNAPGGLTKLEQAVFLGSAFANLEGGALAAFAGAEGYVIADLVTGEVKRTKNGDAPFFGAVPISQSPPGPDSGAAFFPFGTKPFLDGYYPADGKFSDSVFTFMNRITDVSNAGGSLTAEEQLYVDVFGVNFVAYDSVAGSYQPTSEIIKASDFGNAQVSAFEQTAGGPVLVATRNLFGKGSLYYAPRNGSTPTNVGAVGTDARRIRCAAGVCAVTSFADDLLTIALSDGINPPTIIGDVAVGDGPVDLDLKALSNGDVLIGSTGFNDNTWTLTEIDSNGSTVSNTTLPVDDGCTNPGHLSFFEDGEGRKALVTCYGSGNYDIQDTQAFATVP